MFFWLNFQENICARLKENFRRSKKILFTTIFGKPFVDLHVYICHINVLIDAIIKGVEKTYKVV